MTEREAYLIPLEQVVCDFGSVVAWGLRTTGKWAERGTQETREREMRRLVEDKRI